MSEVAEQPSEANPGSSRRRLIYLFVALLIIFVLNAVAAKLFDLAWPAADGSKGKVIKPLLFGFSLAAFLVVIQSLWQTTWIDIQSAKRLFIAALLVPATVIIFLLPPFMAPDEIVHWKTALYMYRADALSEPGAYNLNEVLGTEALLDGKTKFITAHFSRELPPTPLPRNAPVDMGYVRMHAYPVVFAVLSFYPTVRTVREGLFLYYLCRGVQAVAMLLLLYWINRRFELPFSALFLCSLPLYLQQSAAVSADWFLNAGTIVAVMLFITLREKPSTALNVCLWVLCLALIYSKIILAGIIVLPLMLFPWSRVPRKALVFPVLVLMAIALAFVAGNMVLNALRKYNGHFGKEAVESQIAALQTSPGLHRFLTGWWQTILDRFNSSSWLQALGYLDTHLNPHHVFIIKLSGLACLIVDAVLYARRIPGWFRNRRADVFSVAAIIVINILVITLLNSLIYFIQGTRPTDPLIHGMQSRHFFPAAIVALFLPILLLGRRDVHPAESVPLCKSALATTAACIFPLLIFNRSHELFLDLMRRFWS